MSDCSFDAVDALAFGELPPERAAAVSAHVSACGMCELQLRRLRADRTLLSSRARRPVVDLNALRQGVAQRISAQAKARAAAAAARRRSLFAGALSAAALLAVTWLSPALHQPPRREAGAAVELWSAMDPSLSCRGPARWDDRAIFSVENRYCACLVATPRSAPDELALCL